ncbi:MAG TPA: tRNA pseudouridine(38-40) synthase TruA [Solirubrobacterales bacterium]|nr:tRNA pseudouridine(38-40) synthase TruA [Solirubrobacterales bacterium]
MRLRIDLSYDGTDFHGWATQPQLRTVQGTFEAALATVLRVPEVRVVCAGRTDTGVHARGQVAHLQLDSLPPLRGAPEEEPTATLLRRLNGLLPADIRLRSIRQVPESFDARFSATWRRYAYRIADRAEVHDPLTRNHVMQHPRPLDVDAMNDAAALLLGLNDFASFCKQREGATTIRTLQALSWTRVDGIAEATVKADAFCHHMVRALVGCMVVVGEGRRPAVWAGEVLHGRARNPVAALVPANGLTLEEVGYPDELEFGAQADRTRARREAPEAPEAP